MLFRKVFAVKPTEIGFLYRDLRRVDRLEPGVHRRWDLGDHLLAVVLPTRPRLVQVTNQEVLTKDAIALRFSYVAEYALGDPDRFLARWDALPTRRPGPAAIFGWEGHGAGAVQAFHEAEQWIHSSTQAHWRAEIARRTSEELIEQREVLGEATAAGLRAAFAEVGLDLRALMARDVTFPKHVQELFARRLESKIRAQTDLEHARTAVAAARALKNAADLAQGDPGLRFHQWMETLLKIAEKGRHTFMVGDLPPAPPK